MIEKDDPRFATNEDLNNFIEEFQVHSSFGMYILYTYIYTNQIVVLYI